MSAALCVAVFMVGVFALIGFTEWLKVRHRHKWKVIDYGRVFETPGAKDPLFKRYTLQCETCGNIKRVKGA